MQTHDHTYAETPSDLKKKVSIVNKLIIPFISASMTIIIEHGADKVHTCDTRCRHLAHILCSVK